MAKPQEEVTGLMAGEPELAVGSLGRIEEPSWRNFICLSSHPVAAFFHLAFKAAAIFVYMFGRWFLGIDYVTSFVVIVLLSAADFYTTKNITGRLLVGLRWWVHVKEDGSNEWLFESAPNARVPAIDYRIFWWTLYAASGVWVFFATWALLGFSFDWLLVCAVGAGLTLANLVGYFKCSSDAQRRLRSALATGAMAGLAYIPGALPAIGTTMMGLFTAAATSAVAAGGAAAAAGAAASAAGAGGAAATVAAPAAAGGGGAAAPARGGFVGDAGADANPFDEGVSPRSNSGSGGGRGGLNSIDPFASV